MDLGIIQTFISAVVTITIGIVGWVVKDISNLRKELMDYKMTAANLYVKEQTFTRFEDSIKQRFDRQDEKLDTIIDKLEKKADK